MRVLGVAMIVLSLVMWGAVFSIPFLNISMGHKILAGTILTINGEVLFWFGTGILGRDILKKIWNKWKNRGNRKDNNENGSGEEERQSDI